MRTLPQQCEAENNYLRGVVLLFKRLKMSSRTDDAFKKQLRSSNNEMLVYFQRAKGLSLASRNQK
jgi:hypothetical protein